MVVYRGNPQARLMMVGEAPGAEEDMQGLPFVGRSGQLLDDILRAVGLDPEEDAYVTCVFSYCNAIYAVTHASPAFGGMLLFAR